MAAATTTTRTKPVRRERVDARVMAAAPRDSEGLFGSFTSKSHGPVGPAPLPAPQLALCQIRGGFRTLPGTKPVWGRGLHKGCTRSGGSASRLGAGNHRRGAGLSAVVICGAIPGPEP